MDSTANPKVFCMHQTYDNTEPDELNNRPGNGPWEEEQLPGWWHGELNSTRPPGVQALCRAVYSYQPANVDELPLYVGDVLEVLREVEEGWWQGRREGHVGVFPSNFVVMLEPPPGHAAPPFEPAPALPPKPVKEQCRVLFPYTAVNEDELTLAEGDVVTLVTKDTSDRGWWRGELHGRVGLFPDNFVQLLPADPIPNKITPTPEDESKGERPPPKTTNALYPSLSKYSEKTASVKELTTSKISMHKESSVSKESNIQSTVTITSKSEAEKTSHSKTTEGDALKFSDEEAYASKFSAPKKPSVPLKKSPTPTSGVGGLFSGLKNKILPSSDKDKSEKPSAPQPASSNGEWDRPDGGGASKPAAPPSPAAPAAPGATPFDHVERNSILNDPRAGRAKAPRRRPPSQALRDDTPQVIGLSNGHEVPVNKSPTDKLEEIRPRTREWEKHKAPWMEELKLNQAKKTSFSADGKSRCVSSSSEAAVASKAGGGSTDRSFSSRRHKTGSYNRILSCGLEEKRSTHSMEMSKSTSSISNRISVLESLESSLEAKARHSLEPRKESPAREPEPSAAPLLHSPTAAGRTLTATLEDIKKPQAPAPTAARADPPSQSPSRLEKITTSSERTERTERTESAKISVESRSSTMERTEKMEDRATEGPNSVEGTLERRSHSKAVKERSEGSEALIAQLSNRILNLEKLLEVQNAKFNAAIEQLNIKLSLETERRLALQAEIEKLAHCVTQV